MPRRNVITRNGLARPTAAQYCILRYWADNTNDRNRKYVGERGPAPRMHDKTWHLLYQRDWLRASSRDGHEALRNGYIVTDAGRAAIGLPAVGRDHPCPWPSCRAVTGERCVDTDAPGDGPWWPYMDAVHPERTHRDVYLRLSRSYPLAPVRTIAQLMRDEIAGNQAAQAAAARVETAVHAALLDLGVDLRSPVGIVVAT